MTTAVQHPSAPALPALDDAANAPFFEPFTLPASNQRQLGAPHAPGTVAPLALRPTGGAAVDLDAAIDTVKSLQARGGVLSALLAQHGAILFRGLPVRDVNDFSRFAHAFGYKPHEIIGIVLDRPELAPNVSPANESPPNVLLFNHNESPQVPHAPEYIFFNAHKTPKAGGETPVSSSLELFERVQQEIPELIEELAAKGIVISVTYKRQAQYPGGSTLRQAFGKEVVDGDDEVTFRRKVERQIERYGRGPHTTWEWNETDGGLVVTHHLPVIRRQPGTGLPTLFSGLASYYRNRQHNGVSRTYVKQLFGDGSEIPDEWIAKLADITDEITVLHKWQEGDVVVYDNVIAQHGRLPWEGEQGDRIVYASLFDSVIPEPYGDHDWERLVQPED